MSRWLLADAGDDELVFRPEDYPLPLARGRTAIELHGDRSFTAFAPGPDDRPAETSELDDWYVAELREDRLTLRRAAAGP